MPKTRRLISTTAVLGLLVAVSTAALAQVHRPIQDFLDAQIGPPVWWQTAASAPQTFVGQIDYSGYVDKYLVAGGVPSLGTQFSGDVAETLLPDGRIKVRILLQGKNVYMRARIVTDEGILPAFAYGPGEIISGGWPTNAGQCVLILEFINNKGIGGSLPDLGQLLYTPEAGQEFLSILLNGFSQGPLRPWFGVPDGTPGYLQIIQRGLLNTGRGLPGQDGFPVEEVRVGILGKQL